MRRAGVVALLAASLAVTGRAGAVEREHQIGLDAGMPLLLVQRSSSTMLSGASLGLHYTYGLSDAFNLIADGGTSLLFAGRSSMPTLSNVDVGVAYVLDVLTWVPWAGLEAGGYALTSDPGGGTTVFPGAALALGVDYRFSRSWAAGVVLRQHWLFTRQSDLPSFSQGLLRVEYTWGW
jgi:hypothetical protein